ncbi:MAG: DMT family transporter [Ruminiclostridium sp.]|nr:DMT family transporter [Ruminiclostridium sp.]
MEQKKGLLLIFAASVLFSLGGLLIKVIPWQALSINSWRCGISVCILLLFAKVTGKKLKLTPGVLAGAAAMCLTVSSYALANKLTTAANAILIQFTNPVFVILFLWLFFHEKPKKLDIITCMVVFGGIACFFLDGLSAGNLLGNAVALFSGLCYAWVFLLNKIPGGDPLWSTILGHAMCVLIGLPSVARETEYSGQIVLCAILMGVFQLGLAYLCFTIGIRTAPPVSASLVSGIEPILNPVLVAIVLGESLSGLALLGGGIVFISIMIYNILTVRTENTKKELQKI